MNQHWEHFAEEWEEKYEDKPRRQTKKKLSYKEGKQLKEAKRNGRKHPKKRKR